MSFADKLHQLIEELEANNGTIARFAGFDRSQLSRLRTGKLVPRRESSTTAKLVNGIYLYADNRNELDRLCAFTGISPEASGDAFREGILNWLYEGIEETQKAAAEKRPVGRPRKDRAGLRYFGERLNAAMRLAELSNVRLSQLIHLDQSLISRYRSGVRTPEDNAANAERLCEILFSRIERTGCMQELAALMRQPVNEIDPTDFSAWLFHRGDLPGRDILAAEKLLSSFNDFPGTAGSPLPSVKPEAPAEIRGSAATAYYGADGLREAVLRFLGDAVAGNAAELRLYSDENQDWLTADPSFLMKWAALMSACVKNGTHIQIIHNIDRDLAEMSQAITNWLPLYMSGRITSYYSKKQKEHRYCHTMFLWPGHACIESFHAAGTEESIYRYDTEKRELQICEAGFAALMGSSLPLLAALAPDPVVNTDVTVIQNTLSIATMPQELVEAFHQPRLTALWQKGHAVLLKRLENHTISECLPLAAEEALRAGTVSVEAVPDMAPLSYTPQQYALHIQNLVKLSGTYPSYRLYPLPETPFPNIRLLVSETAAQIFHAAAPSFSFGFTHPLMCRAFQGYADSLMHQYRMDRHSLRRMLMEKYQLS